MKEYMVFIFLLAGFYSSYAQSTVDWQKAYGSTGNDKLHGMVATSDGNYVTLGVADSVNGDVDCNIKGKHDEWVIKIDPMGNILWQTCLGGTKEEEQPHNRIVETSDGGFLTAGESWSQDYTSNGNHGECDVLLVKLDSEGKIQWKRMLGGKNRDTPRYLYELPGQKYLLLARTNSKDGNVPTNTLGGYNAVVFKLDKNGKLLSSNLYGGSGKDELWTVSKKVDMLVFTGHTTSPELGAVDTSAWLLKTDLNGAVVNSWVYGNGGNYKFLDMIPVNNNELIACGETGLPEDFWAARLDLQGNMVWNYSYGGNQAELFKSCTRIDDDIYLTGGTNSFGNGFMDCYFVRIDFSGLSDWDLALGGSKMDWANQLTKDGYMCGYTGSNDGDISGFHGGQADGWIAKIILPGLLKSNVTRSQSIAISASKIAFYVYQDAFSNDLQIAFNNPQQNLVRLDLLDINGITIQSLNGSIQQGNTYSLSINRHLSPGIYFLKLTAGDGIAVKKVFIE
jgi:hypothetical protein